MKVISSKGGYAHQMYEVELAEADKKHSDRVLITMADNSLESVTEEKAALIDAPGRSGGICHFGGAVSRYGDKATIKVYTD